MAQPLYMNPPSRLVLDDESLGAMRSSELAERTAALGLLLSNAFRNKALLEQLWDDESFPAWKAIGSEAGALLQRALLKELLSQCAQFVDKTSPSSSIVTCHRNCINPHLKSGEFKSFYMPLYQDIVKDGEGLIAIRNDLLAHQDHQWLLTRLNSSTRDTSDLPFRLDEAFDLMTSYSYYVNLCCLMLGISGKEFGIEHEMISGAEGIRTAILAAHQDQAG